MNSFENKVKTWFQNNKIPVVAVAITMAFIVFNSIMLSKDFFLLMGIPLLGLLVVLFVFKLETALMATALFTPFAVDFAFLHGRMRLYLRSR